MPRPPRRPLPGAYYFLSRPEYHRASQDPPALSDLEVGVFWWAVAHGLLVRLRRIRPWEKWFPGILSDLMSQFELLVGDRGDVAALEEAKGYIMKKVATASAPRRGAAQCDPVLLLVHYDYAAQLLTPSAKGATSCDRLPGTPKPITPATRKSIFRPRSSGARALAIRELAQRLYDHMERGPAECRKPCPRRTTLPATLEHQTFRTDRDLIEFLLCHYHGLRVHQLRHLLDKGPQHLGPHPRIRRAK